MVESDQCLAKLKEIYPEPDFELDVIQGNVLLKQLVQDVTEPIYFQDLSPATGSRVVLEDIDVFRGHVDIDVEIDSSLEFSEKEICNIRLKLEERVRSESCLLICFSQPIHEEDETQTSEPPAAAAHSMLTEDVEPALMLQEASRAAEPPPIYKRSPMNEELSGDRSNPPGNPNSSRHSQEENMAIKQELKEIVEKLEKRYQQEMETQNKQYLEEIERLRSEFVNRDSARARDIKDLQASNKSLAEAVATGEVLLNAADNIAPRLAVYFPNDKSEAEGSMLALKSGQAVGLQGKNGKSIFIVPKWLALAMKKRRLVFLWIVVNEHLSGEELYRKISSDGKSSEELTATLA